MKKTRFFGWSKTSYQDNLNYTPENLNHLQSFIHEVSHKKIKVIQRGQGRSYGDTAFCNNGVVINLQYLNDISGIKENKDSRPYIRCGAGLTIDEIIKEIVPRGYMLPVVAGTRYVSVGGALSNNIHGKNCYKNGAIGEHVKSLILLKSDGELITCSRKENSDIFYHVVGGLGLLGIIVNVELYLEKLISYEMENDSVKTQGLSETVSKIVELKDNYDFCIANVDLFSSKRKYGRSKIALSRFSNSGNRTIFNHDIDPNIVKYFMRQGIKNLSPAFMNSFWIEMVYRLSHFISTNSTNRKISFSQCHFPMDNILPFYNEMFHNGFYEYQALLPQRDAVEGYECLANIQRKYKSKSLMTSMKSYREQSDKFKNSFTSMNGLSQTYDIPKQLGSDHYKRMFYKMNDEVIKRNGRIYLGKTSCIKKDQLFCMYPEMKSLIKMKHDIDPDSLFSSHFYERVILESKSLSSLNF